MSEGMLGTVLMCKLLIIVTLVLIFKGGNEIDQASDLSPSTSVDNHTLQSVNYTSNSSLTTEQIPTTNNTINTTSTTTQPVTSPSGTNPTTTGPPPSTLITEIPKGQEDEDGSCQTYTCQQAVAWLKSSMSESFNPCDNFYQYSCHGWIVENATKLKEEKANSTTVLNAIDKENTKLVTKLIEGIQTRYGAEGKAKRFYSSCNNKRNLMWLMDILMSMSSSNSTSTRQLSESLQRIRNSEDINTWGWMLKDLLETQILFFDKVVKQRSFLVGQERSNPKVCTTLTREFFPEIVAKLFALHHYGLDQDESVTDLTTKIWSTFKSKMVNSTDWIDGINSKLNISTSIGNLGTIVGYLGDIMNNTAIDARYENVSIYEHSSLFLTNLKELLLMRAERKLNIELELERQFDESTPRANAFYHQLLDLIFIPAGIIQLPLFDHELPDLFKFSKLGSTYGHELAHSLHSYIHGVTLEGRSGNSIKLSDPVVNQGTRDNYAKKSACVEQQYSAFQVPLPRGYENTTLFVNGTLTLKENVADIIGVQVAFDSFIENMGSSVPQVPPGLEKFTWQQIFFIASAQERCRSFVNDETEVRLLKEQLKTDLHSPSSIRVLGTFSNNDEFAKAFNCPVGSRYNPEEKCRFFVPTEL